MREFNTISNGKLLLTGEYNVLTGATALVLPLTMRQEFNAAINLKEENTLRWEAQSPAGIWFNVEFNLDDLSIRSSSSLQLAEQLKKELQCIDCLNPGFFETDTSFTITTKLTFKPEWGFGSSSTHLVNLARWTGIDPFKLHRLVSSGSGYDIAAAQYQAPFLYRRYEKEHTILNAHFNPPFSDKLFFVYTGQKQKTSSEVKRFLSENNYSEKRNSRVSEISQACCKATGIVEFAELLDEHETIMSDLLGRPTVKSRYFSDYPYSIKSLGAWGGDFVLFIHNHNPESLFLYLEQKNMDTWFRYDDIVKSSNVE